MTRTPPCALVIACALFAACGKKGPPLAPISHIPAALATPSVTRVGDDMYVSLTVPNKDIDGSTPADVSRIEVYGATGATLPSAAQMLAAGKRVASVPVAAPPLKGEAPPATNEPVQGGMVSILDSLGPADLALPPGPATAPASVEPLVPRRFYMALAYNRRGRPGPPSAVASVPLETTPAPPAGLAATYTADTLTLTWQPAPGTEGAAPLPPAFSIYYNVYRESAPDPLALSAAPAPAWTLTRPMPLNPMPLAVLRFDDATEFDREACYTVRAMRGNAPGALEGEASPPLCVTAVDTFPPAPPKSLSAVAAESSISLIWEPNSEPDLGGYLVLRGEAGSDTLQPLTATPIAEAQFTDRTVQSGVRYVYAVVAVDTRVPVPNTSAESNRVEETAR